MGVRKLFNSVSTDKHFAADEGRPKRQTPQQSQTGSAEIAGYIAQMTAEMGQMADAARLDVLAYLLSMARREAKRSARRASFGEHGGSAT